MVNVKKHLETVIKIKILEIDVDQEYFSIKYHVDVDGETWTDVYEDDYDNGQTPNEWRRTLERGEALNFVQGLIQP